MITCCGQSLRLYVLCISILVDHNGLYQHFVQLTAKFLVEPLVVLCDVQFYCRVGNDQLYSHGQTVPPHTQCLVFPPFQIICGISFVPSQTSLSSTEFMGKCTDIYNTRLVSLNSP
jgi:hypothetical protein